MTLNKLILDNIHVCYPAALLPKQDDGKKSNVFVGIGLWSKSHGLTTGLPIDVLSMLIAADKLRNQLDYDNGIIYVFVADIFALESRSDHPDITEADIFAQRDRTIEIIYEICQWLKIRHVVIEDSRTLLANYSLYQKVVEEVAINHSIQPIGRIALEKTTENYVLKQTALIGFYFREKNCALKISWCYDPKDIGKKPEEIITHGLERLKFDELWFDAYYQLYLGEKNPTGFVYTQSGIALNTSKNNLSSPYFAKNKCHFPRVLFGDSIDVLERKIPVKQFNDRPKKKGVVIKGPRSVHTIPATFKKHMLAIFQDLQEGYSACVQIKSKKNESNIPVIIGDLASIANYGNYQLHDTKSGELTSDEIDSSLPEKHRYSDKNFFNFFRSECAASSSGIVTPDPIPIASTSGSIDSVSEQWRNSN